MKFDLTDEEIQSIPDPIFRHYLRGTRDGYSEGYNAGTWLLIFVAVLGAFVGSLVTTVVLLAVR